MKHPELERRRGVPSASSPATLARMLAAKRRDTKPELILRAALHRRGLRFRVDREILPDVRRRGDIVFTRAGVVVFVDGCFWHGCSIHGTWPKANAAWWAAKIRANRQRDHDTDARLAAASWTVIRAWEHDVLAPVDAIEAAVRGRLEERTKAASRGPGEGPLSRPISDQAVAPTGVPRTLR